MSLTSKKTTRIDASSAVKAAKRTRAAGSAAAANAASAARNATSAARNAAATAQNAAGTAQTAAQNASVIAANAARSASGTAQTAASTVNSGMTKGAKGVRQGVHTARTWAAPRLEVAADYTTDTIAPAVSSALRATARQVRPEPAAKSRKSKVAAWSVLGVAALTAAGAAAVMARYRYRAAIAADSEAAEEEVLGDSTGSQPAPATPEGKETTAENPVNGQVPSRGW